MPSGLNLVTGLPLDLEQYQTENDILDAKLKVRKNTFIPEFSFNVCLFHEISGPRFVGHT